jgi:hypothetical protein
MARLESPFDKWLAKPNKNRGLHHKIFVAANYLIEEGRSEDETFDILREACDEMDRLVPDREIRGAIAAAQRQALGDLEHWRSWPPRDEVFRKQVLQGYSVSQQKLKAQIPAPAPACVYLRQLYRENDLLCVGRTAMQFGTRPLQQLLDLGDHLSVYQFINPSPMSSTQGITQERNLSEHASSNTGPRVYGVVEFDDGSVLEHASFLRCLATQLPLVMMVYSGNASLHGWFKTSHVAEEKIEKFYQQAVSLGADSRMFSPCQFARLPMGTNHSTRRQQRVFYFNLENIYATRGRV